MTLGGTGSVNLITGDVVSGSGATLTIGSGQTLQGATNTNTVGANQVTLINQGLINANTSGGALILDPGAGGLTSSGTLRASNGGILQLSGNGGGAFNISGTIEALAGSEVQLLNAASVGGGTLTTTGTGIIRSLNSTTLSNVTNQGTFIANNVTTTTLANTITNNGTISIGASGTGNATLTIQGSATLAGTGSVNLITGDVVSGSGATLTIGSGQTFQGATNTNSVGANQVTLINQGTINANTSGGTLILDPGTGGLTNSGTLQADNGGTLQFSSNGAGTLTNNGVVAAGRAATVTIPAGSLTNFSGSTLTGGTYSVDSLGAAGTPTTATLSLGGGSIVTNNASVSLRGAGAVFTEINALANNQGTFQVATGRNFNTAGTLTNSGTLAANAATLTTSGNLTNSGLTLVYGNGTIAVQGALTNSGQLATGTGPGNTAAVTVTGTLNQTTTGILFGSGSVSAASLALAGTVRPGDSDFFGSISPANGTLTLNGQVGLLTGTTLLFDLGSTASSDRIAVNGAFTLDGMLNVNAVTGFGAGRYDLIDYTGLLTNNGLDLGTLPTGYNYAIDTSITGQVDLVVTNAVPEPSTWAAALLGLGLLTLLRRRVAR